MLPLALTDHTAPSFSAAGFGAPLDPEPSRAGDLQDGPRDAGTGGARRAGAEPPGTCAGVGGRSGPGGEAMSGRPARARRAGRRPWPWLWKEAGGGPAPPRPSRPPLSPAHSGAARGAGRATRSPAGADPDGAPPEPARAAALQGQERPRRPALQVKAGAGAAARAWGAPRAGPAWAPAKTVLDGRASASDAGMGTRGGLGPGGRCWDEGAHPSPCTPFSPCQSGLGRIPDKAPSCLPLPEAGALASDSPGWNP